MRAEQTNDPNCLSYWFPKLLRSGVRVPETHVVTTDVQLISILDGKIPDGHGELIRRLVEVADEIGYPCFLRTGQGSGKHEWERTCYLTDRSMIHRHVCALVEWSATVDFMGLPMNVWVVREMLSLRTAFTAFHGFPVNKERRYFIRDGHVVCHHSYWPEDSIEFYGADKPENWRQRLAKLNRELPKEVEELSALAKRVAAHFDGYWSLDFAQTVDGTWYAIDMAEGDRSFHWPGCENANR